VPISLLAAAAVRRDMPTTAVVAAADNSIPEHMCAGLVVGNVTVGNVLGARVSVAVFNQLFCFPSSIIFYGGFSLNLN
jgi:hypothetical protein